MAKKCKITGKSPLTGNKVSHANNKNKRRQMPNLKKKKYYIVSENKWVTIRLSTKAIKILDKVDLPMFLKKKNLKLSDISSTS